MRDKPFIELASPKTRTPLKRLSNDQADADDVKQQKSNPYELVKRYFHRSAQVRIVGRTAERAMIQNFWTAALDKDQRVPRVLYICGNPGTGKTALIEEMLPDMSGASKNCIGDIFKVNCMMQEDPRGCLDDIAKSMQVKKHRGICTDKYTETLLAIEEQLSRSKKFTIFIMDEIDQIAMRDSGLLERIFKLPYVDGVNLVIIGIANALDLSIKYFAAPPEEVQVLNFAPYSVEDIVRILIARAELAAAAGKLGEKENASTTSTSSWQSIIAPVVLEICARKVSSTNDLRKALEIIRDAISLAEKESESSGKFIPVHIQHATHAMDRIFGTTVRTASRNAQMIQELNLHQKILLATLHRLLQDSKSLKPTVHGLFDRYTANTRSNRIIDAVTRSEFNDLISNTESMGIIALIAPGKRTKNTASGTVSPDTKVILSIPLEDVNVGLSSNPILKALL